MKALDFPAFWLLLFIGASWGFGRIHLFTVGFSGQGTLALLILLVGVALIGLAIREMSSHQTTIEPRRTPTTLVTSGVFRYSRNPIYLGKFGVLLAAIFWFGSLPALVLLWVFVRLMNKRYIFDEEMALRAEFSPQFDAWARATRRWI